MEGLDRKEAEIPRDRDVVDERSVIRGSETVGRRHLEAVAESTS